MDIRTATPREIDERLADYHQDLFLLMERLERARVRVFDWAGRRKYVPATWQNRRSRYETTGTYEEAREIVERQWEAIQAYRASDFKSELRPNRISDYDIPYDGPEETIAAVERLSAERYRKLEKIQELNNEYARRPWPRYWLVTSSAGHIHKSTNCQTCRPTTGYGWMPQMSGQTEAESVAALGRHADSLCSVCFPSAPVAAKRTHVTKAQAAKMSAAPYVGE